MNTYVRPEFIQVEDGAPPGTVQAFDELAQLVHEQPDTALAVFRSLGTSIKNVIESGRAIVAGDDSPSARTTRLISRIIETEMDLETDFGEAVDDATRRKVKGARGEIEPDERRVIRLGELLTHLAAPPESTP